MNAAHTPGPWFVRSRKVDGEVVDCFVVAKDVQGFAYDAEILGDDEYREGIARRLADCSLIASAPDLLEALEEVVEFFSLFAGGSERNRADALRMAIAAIAKATPPVEVTASL